jgi:enoyl-CoA hydratase
MSGGRIGLAELSVGVPFPTTAVEIVRHAAGPAAGRLVLTAELLDVAAAQAIGLVTRSESVVDDAVARAASMGEIPEEVFAFSKRQLRQPVWERISKHAADDETVLEVWSSEETRVRIAAYMASLGG